MSALGRVAEVFLLFFRLGCISFGGPTAHLALFEETFVRKRSWLSAEDYVELVALCQFLPGPGSSQVGFGIGLKRAGIAGAFAAWLGFTAPAAVIMIGFALGLGAITDLQDAAWLDGLLVAAVAVVANALLNMAKKLCATRLTMGFALVASIILILFPYTWLQLLVILVGGIAGFYLFEESENQRAVHAPSDVKMSLARICLGSFFALLIILPLWAAASGSEIVAIADVFYRAGSLVFGGGHVVLPLLDDYTVGAGWLGEKEFLAGYGAAQAIPGPMFAFTAYLGAVVDLGWSGVWGGVFALLATYLPAWLLVLGCFPVWERLRSLTAFRSALKGVNAVVVGLLGAAFYNPVLLKGLQGLPHIALAIGAFAALRFGKIPPWGLVTACAALGQFLL